MNNNYFKKQTHSFHLVAISPLPLITAFGTLFLTVGMVSFFHKYSGIGLFLFGFLFVALSFFLWMETIIDETTYYGFNSKNVVKGLRLGFILFVVSEAMLFFSFFWAHLHSYLNPIAEFLTWPPLGIEAPNPFEVPFLNTLVLLCSGVTCTWAHAALIQNVDNKHVIKSLIYTIILALVFTLLQLFEYLETTFTMSSGIYGSTFFLTTGFHGIHVIIGTSFLFVCLLRQLKVHFSKKYLDGFDFAAWYWHFVDAIWIFVYFIFYYIPHSDAKFEETVSQLIF